MLHGLGDTGDGWSDIASDFQTGLPHVKFIFPTAPRRSITLNMGMKMTGWYDIASLEDINQREDAEGVLESKRWEDIFHALDLVVPAPDDALCGFSSSSPSPKVH